MPHRLPQELLNEIIGYNWNDIPSLKACSRPSKHDRPKSKTIAFYMSKETAEISNIGQE